MKIYLKVCNKTLRKVMRNLIPEDPDYNLGTPKCER
jgi:hypothetical protein